VQDADVTSKSLAVLMRVVKAKLAWSRGYLVDAGQEGYLLLVFADAACAVRFTLHTINDALQAPWPGEPAAERRMPQCE
jgi:hypothetical protein